ncbi:hypothetical protein OFC56_30790, partial [Escherichia coli]|nr:hypothetical protein [Escherichia coli]
EAFFPNPVLNPSDTLVNALAAVAGYEQGNQAIEISAAQSVELAAAFEANGDAANASFATKAAESAQPLVLVILATDEQPQSVAEGFLKLQLIS